MAARGTRDVIHVELPSFNPFAAEEPPRRPAADQNSRAESDYEDFSPDSDNGGVVPLPNVNPFAASNPRGRPRNHPVRRDVRPRGGRRRPAHTPPDEDDDKPRHGGISVELPSYNPLGPEPEPSRRRADSEHEEESEEDSDIDPPRMVNRRIQVDSIGSDERRIIKDYSPPSSPKRIDPSFSDEEEERAVIGSAVGAQDSDEPASDEERPTVELPSENPFGPPVVRSRSRSPMLDKGHREKQGHSYIDDQGVIYVELPIINPFTAEPKHRRRASSIEDTLPVDLPTTNPFGPRRVNADSENEDEGASVTASARVNPFAR